MERVALVARLKPEAEDRTSELAMVEPIEPAGITRTMLEPWLPLFDGPLHRGAELAHWEM
jgi:hypothetical protein